MSDLYPSAQEYMNRNSEKPVSLPTNSAPTPYAADPIRAAAEAYHGAAPDWSKVPTGDTYNPEIDPGTPRVDPGLSEPRRVGASGSWGEPAQPGPFTKASTMYGNEGRGNVSTTPLVDATTGTTATRAPDLTGMTTEEINSSLAPGNAISAAASDRNRMAAQDAGHAQNQAAGADYDSRIAMENAQRGARIAAIGSYTGTPKQQEAQRQASMAAAQGVVTAATAGRTRADAMNAAANPAPPDLVAQTAAAQAANQSAAASKMATATGQQQIAAGQQQVATSKLAGNTQSKINELAQKLVASNDPAEQQALRNSIIALHGHPVGPDTQFHVVPETHSTNPLTGEASYTPGNVVTIAGGKPVITPFGGQLAQQQQAPGEGWVGTGADGKKFVIKNGQKVPL